MNGKFVILLILFFWGNHLFAQEKTVLSGVVLNIQTLSPVENVSVLIEGSEKGTNTDSEGFFIIRNLVPGKYTMKFSHLGFKTAYQKVIVTAGINEVPKIFLTPQAKNLEEFVVEEHAEGEVISKLPYVQTRFYKPEFQKGNAHDVGDFLRSSKNINGIRKGGGQIDPVVRGFKFSQLNVMINGGHKVEGGCPNRMDPASSHVELENLDGIEIIKGPYSFRYGPSLGGTINLITTTPEFNTNKPVSIRANKSYESNWNGNKEDIAVFGNIHRFYYNFSAGQKHYGNYKDGSGNEINSKFSKCNFNGTIGYQFAEKHSIIIRHKESIGRDVFFPALPMDERKDDTRLSSIDYKADGLKGVLSTLNLKLYNSKVRHEMDNKNRPFSDTVVAVSVIHALNTGGRAEAGFKTKNGVITAGVDYERIRKDGEREKAMILQPGLPVKIEKLWNNAQINNLGFFAEFSGTLHTLELLGSVRADFNKANSDSIVIFHPAQGEIYNYADDSIKSNFTNISASLGVTKPINEYWAVSVSAGRGARSPDMTERFIILLPIGYDKFDYLGNPRLKPEINNQVDLTFKYTNRKYGRFQLNGFYSLVNDFITGKRLPPSVQKPLSKDVLGVKQFYNAGNAQLRGFELSYASPAQNKLEVSVFASFTYGTLDESLQYIMNDAGDVIDDLVIKNDALTEIPPFEATFNFKYKFFENRLIPSVRIRAVSSQNHVSEASYEEGSEGFVLTSLFLTYELNEYFTVSGGVKNLFDVAYYEHLNRNIIGSNKNLYEPGRSLFINLKFNL